jgi:hypothetical protein
MTNRQLIKNEVVSPLQESPIYEGLLIGVMIVKNIVIGTHQYEKCSQAETISSFKKYVMRDKIKIGIKTKKMNAVLNIVSTQSILLA